MAEGSDENHRNLSQDSQSPVKDSNLGRPEYEEGVLHFRVIPNPFITNSEYMHCLGTVPSAPTHKILVLIFILFRFFLHINLKYYHFLSVVNT
jgi:hypothetical protein